jgi:hypothetical protein
LLDNLIDEDVVKDQYCSTSPWIYFMAHFCELFAKIHNYFCCSNLFGIINWQKGGPRQFFEQLDIVQDCSRV